MRPEKLQIVREIKGLIENKPFILISYKGLNAAGFAAFRATLHQIAAECHVVPNKLFQRACLELGAMAPAEAELGGDTALVCGADAVAIAKAVRDFVNLPKSFSTVKFGYLDGVLLSPADVVALADLPPKEVLQAQLLGLLQAPATQLVRVLNAKVSSIVYVLNAFLQKKEQVA